jgi:hypothetical protein
MGYLNIPMLLWFVLLVANFWSKRYSQNHCPLALKIGTRHANLLKGSALHVWVIPLGGVILCIFLLSDAVFLCYRDIFSVTKLTRSLVIVEAACYYVVFSHCITWVEKYINICHEFLFWICSMLFLLGGGECYFISVYFDLFFLTDLYIYVVWWTETSGEAFSS